MIAGGISYDRFSKWLTSTSLGEIFLTLLVVGLIGLAIESMYSKRRGQKEPQVVKTLDEKIDDLTKKVDALGGKPNEGDKKA